MSEWACEAYGDGGAEIGARCFFAELHERVCVDEAQCRAQLADERRRVFRAINESAAQGDPTMAFLAEEFDSPDRLLGGDGQR